MRRFTGGHRPTPALIVAFIALFVAMGGVGYSALKLPKNSVKTKNIKNGAVTTPKLAADAKAPLAGKADSATTATTANNAQQLGGIQPAGFQRFCQPGAIKGSFVGAVVNTQIAYTTVTGFNCTGAEVRVRYVGLGVYNVWIVDNPQAGSAVVSTRESVIGRSATYDRITDTQADTPAAQDQQVFQVKTFATSPVAAQDFFFSLLVF